MWIKGEKFTEEHRKKLSEIKKKNLPKYAFKKGQRPSVVTEFKKGHTSPNKGVYRSNGYAAIHYWIKQVLGKPSYCGHCRRTDLKKYEWANVSGKYLRDTKDWIRLCSLCHHKFDGINTKLTEEKVRQIRELSSRGVYQREIAVMFGVSRPNISSIITGKSWRWLLS